MKALVLYGPRNAKVEDLPIPQPPSGWCLVKTLAVGICGTDKAFYTGTYELLKKPLVIGHEVVGIVVSNCDELTGKAVVPEINFSCLKCDFCRSGLYTHCPYKKTLGIDFDGGFAEYFIAPSWALHVVNNLDPKDAIFVEPLAALIHGLNLYPPRITDRCAVIGTGTLAYLLVQLLKLMGVDDVALIARSESRKVKYFESLGLEILTIDEVLKCSKDPHHQYDVVFDVSGSTTALDVAIQIAKPRGLIHIKSTPGAPFKAHMTLAVVKELTIVCSRCGTFKDFDKAIDLISSNRIKLPPTKVFKGLDNAINALEESVKGIVPKVVVMI